MWITWTEHRSVLIYNKTPWCQLNFCWLIVLTFCWLSRPSVGLLLSSRPSPDLQDSLLGFFNWSNSLHQPTLVAVKKFGLIFVGFCCLNFIVRQVWWRKKGMLFNGLKIIGMVEDTLDSSRITRTHWEQIKILEDRSEFLLPKPIEDKLQGVGPCLVGG